MKTTQTQTSTLRSFQRTGLLLISCAAFLLSGCGHKRLDHGPWEYAELSSEQYTSQSDANSAMEKPSSNSKGGLTVRFETRKLLLEATNYQELANKLGKKKLEQDCSTAILDELDREGWELVDHSVAVTHAATVSDRILQGSSVGAVATSAVSQTNVWTLRRSR